MSLHVAVTHHVGRIVLDVAFESGGGLTAIVGPSGAGKTTLLHIIAGLLRPDRGIVRLDNESLVDTTTRTWQPPHRRRIGYVTQEPRLFPHLSVRQNVRYGYWFLKPVDRRRGSNRSWSCSISNRSWCGDRRDSRAANSSAWRWRARC